jgi:prepilin-type N-terminal cleavage/methylation domain-containing protein
MTNKRTNQLNKGFTLIELLVVISIMSVMASIIFVSIGSARQNSRDAARISQLAEVQKALELYYSIHNSYPSMNSTTINQNWGNLLDLLHAEKLLAENTTDVDHGISFIDKVYAAINKSVQDPLYPKHTYGYMPSGPAGSIYENQNFRIRAQLENLNNPVLKDSLIGRFLYSDESADPNDPDYSASNFKNECAPDHGYYCIGPVQNTAKGFAGFAPGKPVVYLYPEKDTEVSVKIYPKSVDQSVPVYDSNRGWDVIAHPDGKLDNISDGQSYPYLYWEGQSTKPYIDLTKGAVVPTNEVHQFLVDSLHAQGLNDNESVEFIEYWEPRMITASPFVYVYFMPKHDYDKLVPMTISPKPDTLIRVYMLFKPVNQKFNVTAQKFTSPERIGFTAVEWGGDRSFLK